MQTYFLRQGIIKSFLETHDCHMVTVSSGRALVNKLSLHLRE